VYLLIFAVPFMLMFESFSKAQFISRQIFSPLSFSTISGLIIIIIIIIKAVVSLMTADYTNTPSLL